MYQIQPYVTTIRIMAPCLAAVLGAMCHFWMAYRRKCRQLERAENRLRDAQDELENERRRYASARSLLNLIHNR